MGFEQVSPEASGISFANQITETPELNYFVYPYLYLGGGVAAGDFNNDGLTDLFFTGNMVPNRLYLNKGDWKFEDISEQAGIRGDSRWYTGVTLVDINQDGWMDIYVSVSGKGTHRQNQLFINQGLSGKIKFVEEAEKWGIADQGPSIQSAFFDYDRDGDLDLFVANYPPAPFGSPNEHYLEKMKSHEWTESDHLYRNDGQGKFEDVSQSSGIDNYGLTLGISVADLDGDGWEDLYLSNDFNTPDRCFMNRGDGTFEDRMSEMVAQTALFGMGSDAADYNNDGLIDLVQVDMTPKDNRRAKENMSSMNPSLFWNTVRMGFHYQYMYNALQLNRGQNSAGNQQFSNASRIAGISSTDWSWAPLFADLDNDGWKDLFITNGIKRDVTNRDFYNEMKVRINFTGDFASMDYEQIPSEPVENYAFRNQGDLTFEDVGKSWGLNLKGFSNGAVYADLDNDGDLDLVTHNVDAPAGLFRNQQEGNAFLRIKLEGPATNSNGIGAKVILTAENTTQTQHLSLSRGFQSSVEPLLHFGVGTAQNIEHLHIIWPDGKEQTLENIAVNQLLSLKYTAAHDPQKPEPAASFLFTSLSPPLGLSFKHLENGYNDFMLEPLLPYQSSRIGPFMSQGDANGDGLIDVFIGSSYNTESKLFLQRATGQFEEMPGPWQADRKFEDMHSLFFDADGDGDQDLYVVSGGNEFFERPDMLQDRLYINKGGGEFVHAKESLPLISASGSVVKAADIDGDGDTDLFVGGRLLAGQYPLPAQSNLLVNEGGRDENLRFTDAGNSLLPSLEDAGMVTDALWEDLNADGRPDLLICGEWMPIRVFLNLPNGFVEQTEKLGLSEDIGWWQSLAAGDFDGDGDTDFIAGNIGTNFKYKASAEAPFSVYSGDYDGNGRLDIVLGYEQNGTQFPLRGRQCSSEQIPAIEMKFKDYKSFAIASLEDIYGPQNLESSLQYHATNFASCFIENTGKQNWQIHPLPTLAQLSSVNDILVQDLDEDEVLDLIIAGNLYWTEVETPRNDASYGLFLRGLGNGQFEAIDAAQSGLFLSGDVKDLALVPTPGPASAPLLLATKNEDSLQVFSLLPSNPLP